MAAFERIQSGIPTMDIILDNIRIGDNVVMQVNDLKDFKKMAEAFTLQAIRDHRNLNYIRFANHAPILEPQEGLNIYEVNPKAGFEQFTVKVHDIISQEGVEAFYVFDSLSDLQVAWSTDLMMGNFFCVTCPYLFELDTVAYFPLLRGYHDYATIARIQGTTQLLLDIYSNETTFYLHPIKVWNRYSTSMFLPHKRNGEQEFESISNSIDLSDYYRLLQKEQASHAEQNIDSYDRFFQEVKASYDRGEANESAWKRISKSMMTHDPKLAGMIQKEFTPQDYFFVKERLIGTGTIGGKACGMLLARKMVENYLPQYAGSMEPHDSFYIGSDVYYSFLVENKLWRMRILQHNEENYFSMAKDLAQGMLKGQFPESIRQKFRRMLEYFGQIPIIVRSSSFLEDGFGNAFAGKYESVFCPNNCRPEERLLNFENAVRRVYASTMDPSALEYRRKRGMENEDEQMAILVQRVSGTKFGDYYMPCVAGVGFSYSVYRWSDELREDAGLLRLVAGLGTKAVDRTGMDYPRLVNLDKPESTTHVNAEEKHRFSQRKLEAINLVQNSFAEVDAFQMIPKLPKWYADLVCEHDYNAERAFLERGKSQSIQFITMQGVVRNQPLMSMLKSMLDTLQEHYGTPVDTEYTINFKPNGSFIVNLLQCRPLHVWQQAQNQKIPSIAPHNILFCLENTFMGKSAKLHIDVVVKIDSRTYHNYPYNQKSTIASIVGQINQHYKNSDKTLMLISPGRIGTSSPELGVTVSFSDISNFGILCEYADKETGLVPELSYGSHMFQDIVETEMFYVAIMDVKGKNSSLFLTYFTEEESVLETILPSFKNYHDIIQVYEITNEKPLNLYADFKNRTVICGRF